jgi:tetratricopeptide (TPR) repeat protein
VPAGAIGGAAILIIVAVMIAWMSGVWDGAPDRSAVPAAASDADAAQPTGGAPSTPVSAATRPPVPERAPDATGLPGASPKGQPAAGSPGGARIQRRPGESADAWRSRGAALQMRYGYSKAALDRGDFAAAAGGFEAILMEEPGFLDAAGLLVQAQSGLRRSAQRLFQAGRGLDEAGDWVGALQKYQEARQIQADIPGLAEGIQRVRKQLRVAGTNAFNQARQLETSGQPQEALKEYEKALQWLPPDDPNRQVARARVEQLRKDD